MNTTKPLEPTPLQLRFMKTLRGLAERDADMLYFLSQVGTGKSTAMSMIHQELYEKHGYIAPPTHLNPHLEQK